MYKWKSDTNCETCELDVLCQERGNFSEQKTEKTFELLVKLFYEVNIFECINCNKCHSNNSVKEENGLNNTIINWRPFSITNMEVTYN